MRNGSLDTADEIQVPIKAHLVPAAIAAQTSADLLPRRPLGAWARDVYRRYCLWPKGFLDRASPFGQTVLIPLYYTIRLVFFLSRDGWSVRRQRRIPLSRQLLALWTLVARYRTDPSAYYSSHLYEHPSGLAAVEDYLGRDEIKNGLMKRLHLLQPKIHGKRVSLGNKLRFTQHCVASDLPVAAVICVVKRGTWLFDGAPASPAQSCLINRDIFVKPVMARGARGAEWFDWLGDDRYRNKQGREMSRAEVIRHINRKARLEAILVLPKLVNHPEIADLATDSLAVFRVFTCLDAQLQPQVTHGMLRILGKLEPSWADTSEFGVKVDLETYRLGQLCDDAHYAPDAWWDRHPHTHTAVRWRHVSNWPAVTDLARRAHRAFIDRTVIGWDIALTPDGPMLIEGNAYPDTEFLQRVHRQLIGKSPLAPLLTRHINRVIEAATAGGAIS